MLGITTWLENLPNLSNAKDNYDNAEEESVSCFNSDIDGISLMNLLRNAMTWQSYCRTKVSLEHIQFRVKHDLSNIICN